MSPPSWGSHGSHTQAWAWYVGIPVADSGRSGLLLAVMAYSAAVGVLNIYDIVLAHNVPAYIPTRKWQHRGRSLRSMTARLLLSS